MHRFREVENHLDEKRILKDKKSDDFKKIKPETNITFEEAQDFWTNYFSQRRIQEGEN